MLPWNHDDITFFCWAISTTQFYKYMWIEGERGGYIFIFWDAHCILPTDDEKKNFKACLPCSATCFDQQVNNREFLRSFIVNAPSREEFRTSSVWVRTKRKADPWFRKFAAALCIPILSTRVQDVHPRYLCQDVQLRALFHLNHVP